MYAISFDKQKFLTMERLEQYLRDQKTMEREYHYSPYNRIVNRRTLEVIEVNYHEVYPAQLDKMFYQQTQSIDNKMATGAAKRTSNVEGYDAQLVEDDGEEF